MTIYRNGVAEPNANPAVVDVLRAHEWNGWRRRCACGWTQTRSGADRLNHPVHVATAIAAAVKPVRDIRFSDMQPGDDWLFDAAWVRVVDVEVNNPDDRVTITYEQDGERNVTRENRGFERAAVR